MRTKKEYEWSTDSETEVDENTGPKVNMRRPRTLDPEEEEIQTPTSFCYGERITVLANMSVEGCQGLFESSVNFTLCHTDKGAPNDPLVATACNTLKISEHEYDEGMGVAIVTHGVKALSQTRTLGKSIMIATDAIGKWIAEGEKLINGNVVIIVGEPAMTSLKDHTIVKRLIEFHVRLYMREHGKDLPGEVLVGFFNPAVSGRANRLPPPLSLQVARK